MLRCANPGVTLAAMNWRRGLLLAGINLLVAIPMMCIRASEDARARSEWRQQSAVAGGLWIDSSGEASVAPTKIVPVQEEQTVSFNSCAFWRNIPVQEEVVQMGNLPAFIVSQWRVDCPSKWSLARILGVNDSGLLSDVNFRAMRRVDVALCFLIMIQWFFIGGYPMIQPTRWWSEPGAFITACTAVGSAVALIPVIEIIGRLPAFIAFLGWVAWFGLLIWQPVRLAFRSTLGRQRRLNN